MLHRALGLAGHDWQSLYHFTVGAPVEDLRIGLSPIFHFEEITIGTIFAHVYKTLLFLLLLTSSWRAAQGASPATNSVNDGRVLILENSTMPLTTAKATLIIGPLTRTNNVYVGDFKVNIFPYFFKSDRGRLAIKAPDETLAAFNQGKVVTVTGTSTSNKDGIVRHIEITATPQDCEHGTISLWFMAGDQKMIFTPIYHFTNNALNAHQRPKLADLPETSPKRFHS